MIPRTPERLHRDPVRSGQPGHPPPVERQRATSRGSRHWCGPWYAQGPSARVTQKPQAQNVKGGKASSGYCTPQNQNAKSLCEGDGGRQHGGVHGQFARSSTPGGQGKHAFHTPDHVGQPLSKSTWQGRQASWKCSVLPPGMGN